MAFHALADYQNHVIGWLQWEQSSLGDGAVVRFPRIWMSSGECRLNGAFGTENLFIAARLMSVFLVLGTAVLIAAAFARRSVTIAALFCSLILINPFVLSVAREIGSQSFPLFLLAASVFVATRNLEMAKKAFFLSLFIGIATSAKLNQILLLPGILFLIYGEDKLTAHTVAVAFVGLALGLSPIVYFVFSSPLDFYQHNVTFHLITNIVRGPELGNLLGIFLIEIVRFGTTMAVPALAIVFLLASRHIERAA